MCVFCNVLNVGIKMLRQLLTSYRFPPFPYCLFGTGHKFIDISIIQACFKPLYFHFSFLCQNCQFCITAICPITAMLYKHFSVLLFSKVVQSILENMNIFTHVKIVFIQCEVKMTGLIVVVVLVCDLQSVTWETVRSTRNGSWSNDAR